MRGTVSIQLEVPSLHDFVVSALNVRRGTSLQLRPFDADPDRSGYNSLRMDANGTVTFTSVPAGRYILSSDFDKDPVEVTVPGPEFVYDRG